MVVEGREEEGHGSKWDVEGTVPGKWTALFQPIDAHQAKSFLNKNLFLSKLACLFNFDQFILFGDCRRKVNVVQTERFAVSDSKTRGN